MALTANDALRLRNAGFIAKEISVIHKAVDPAGNPQNTDLDSPAWRAAMQSRRDWIRNRRSVGWSQDMIFRALERFYNKDESRNPFQFIVEEYRLGSLGKRISNYKAARAKRAARDIGRSSLKGYHARKR